MQRSIRRHFLAIAFAGPLAATAASGAPVDDVRALVESNQSAAAWAACAAIDRTQVPAADLWCGIAAVDTGHTGEGVLALERYTLLNPTNTRAHLELARAYFYSGDDVRARTEFEQVAATHPPPAVMAGIERYLDALSAREAQYLAKLTGFVEFGGGYDSNANAGVTQANIWLPVLGAVTVADFGVHQGSAFGALAAAIQYNKPVAPGWAVYGGATGSGTFYTDASEFNLAQLGANLGASYHANAESFALTYAYGQILLDSDKYRWTNGLAFEWRHQLSPTATISVIPQIARIEYSGANEAQNADFWAVSVGGRYGWLTRWQPVLNASVSVGRQRDTEGFDYLGRDVYGANADVTVSPDPLWAFNFGLAYLRSDFNGALPIVDVTRRDNNLNATLGALYLFHRHWSAKLEYQYQRNDSNLALYDYTRNVVALKVRYEFN
ncbi:MAG: DUF560 domain-containing protein [Proteobacteria bacterium]|nr:DUF560 domain-containing protein [Pseudomonadota bacterium]